MAGTDDQSGGAENAADERGNAMQTQGFMELTCAASGRRNTWLNIRDYGIGGGSRKKVAGNGQCFSVYLRLLVRPSDATQSVVRKLKLLRSGKLPSAGLSFTQSKKIIGENK